MAVAELQPELRVAELRVAELRVAELRVAELRVAELRVAELKANSIDMLQVEKERSDEIDRDNMNLLKKMQRIMRTEGNVDHRNTYSHHSYRYTHDTHVPITVGGLYKVVSSKNWAILGLMHTHMHTHSCPHMDHHLIPVLDIKLAILPSLHAV